MLNFSYNNINGMYENWILWKKLKTRNKSYVKM